MTATIINLAERRAAIRLNHEDHDRFNPYRLFIPGYLLASMVIVIWFSFEGLKAWGLIE